jgi:hypothetical protein
VRARTVLALIAAVLAVCPVAVAAKQYPHTKPLSQMTAQGLAAWQQAAVRHYSYVWHRWWHTHRYPATARGQHARCAATGVRMPAWVCWYASAARWTQRELEQTRAKLVPPVGHLALWQCITTGAYPGAPHEGNGYNGQYSGPLGMTTPWAGHMPPGRDWVHSDPMAVYAIADQEAQKHSYSDGWMRGQWPATYPPCADR